MIEIIRMQNQIAAGGLEAGAVTELITERARTLTGAAAAAVRSANQTACPEARSILCAALPAGRALEVWDPRLRAFGPQDAETLELLAAVLAAHTSGQSVAGGLQSAGEPDPLAELHNRGALEARLGQELQRRRAAGLAVCLIDLEDAEPVAEGDAHPPGEQALSAVAAELHQLRAEDSAYRIGEEEFALLLAGASLEGAAAVAARIEASVRRKPECRGVSASTGIAVARAGDRPRSLMERADAALQASKRARPRARAELRPVPA
jgi:diguanylate cyclase (GGDEF)-like protein